MREPAAPPPGCCSAWMRLPHLFNRALRHQFRALGHGIAKYPRVLLGASLIMVVLSAIGCHRFGILDEGGVHRVRTGYTPYGAPSRLEWDALRRFYDNGADPLLFKLMLVPQPFTDAAPPAASADDFEAIISASRHQSILEPRRLQRLLDFELYMMNECAIDYEGDRVTLSQLCEPHCNLNTPFILFANALTFQVDRLRDGRSLSPHIRIDYPVTRSFQQDIFIGDSVFHVHRNNSNSTDDEYQMGIQGASMVTLYFRMDRPNRTRKWRVESWVRHVDDCIKDFHANSSEVGFFVARFDDVTISDELVRNGLTVMPNFTIGFLLMLAFVQATLHGSAWLKGNRAKWTKRSLVGVSAVVSPCLAVISAMGLMFWFGAAFHSILVVSPFLVLAIGVDDAFLLIESWLWHSGKSSATEATGERLGNVLADVGPSILITSLTNTIAFAVGIATPTPVITLFCQATALSIAIDFLYQLTIFTPILLLCLTTEPNSGAKVAPADQQPSDSSPTKRADKVLHCASKWLYVYCGLLRNWFVRVMVLITLLCYWTVMMYFAVTISSSFEVKRFFLSDSPMMASEMVREEYYWQAYYPIMIIFEWPGFDPNNGTHVGITTGLLSQLEQLRHCKGSEWTDLWLADWDRFRHVEQQLLPFDARGADGRYLFDQLSQFLAVPEYHRWKYSINSHMNNVSRSVIDSFSASVVFENGSDWNVRYDIIKNVRRVLDSQTLVKASMFEADSFMVDQIDSCLPTTRKSVLITLACMFVVCLLLLPTPQLVLAASASIGSICLGVVGALHMWGVDMGLVSMTSILMSVGFSVDYTAHVCYHFHRSGEHSSTVPEQMHATLSAVTWPMLQAAVRIAKLGAVCSSLLCVSVLLIVPTYMTVVFVKTVLLSIGLGMLHGLLFLPVALCALPKPAVTTASAAVAADGSQTTPQTQQQQQPALMT